MRGKGLPVPMLRSSIGRVIGEGFRISAAGYFTSEKIITDVGLPSNIIGRFFQGGEIEKG